MTLTGMNRYADRLRYALHMRGMSQSELARQLGVKPQAIQYLCKQGSSSRHSPQIARILRISFEWLTENIGNPNDMDHKALEGYSPAVADAPSEAALHEDVIVDILDLIDELACQQNIELTNADRAYHIAVNYQAVLSEHTQEQRYRTRITRLVQNSWPESTEGGKADEASDQQPSGATRG